uniref:LIM and SH3 domain protein 1 n=1 Tax=Podarcis muralis TaxID=64176 RepID=A0A670IW49_PODMU
MNPSCARCGKIVYPTEKVNCLDKFWHKACFHCEVCKMTLNMKNYKGYEKKPYCNAHYPKQSFTMVADTPENLRLKQQSELQSQVSCVMPHPHGSHFVTSAHKFRTCLLLQKGRQTLY